MHSFLKTQTEITAWLREHSIENYALKPHADYGFIVDVEGGVSLTQKWLTHLPVKFDVVTGWFDCSYNFLSSLHGSPNTVGEDFYCYANRLTNLLGGPFCVGKNYICNACELKSLRGCPATVAQHFNCSDNQLTSLEFAPAHVKGVFLCDNNKLSSLEFCPSSILDNFSCQNNQIESLDFFPQYVGGAVLMRRNEQLGEAQTIPDFQSCLSIHQQLVLKKEIRIMPGIMPNHTINQASITQRSYKI